MSSLRKPELMFDPINECNRFTFHKTVFFDFIFTWVR